MSEKFAKIWPSAASAQATVGPFWGPLRGVCGVRRFGLAHGSLAVCRVLDYFNTENFNIHERAFQSVRLHVFDVQDHFCAFVDAAEDRVLVVEPE